MKLSRFTILLYIEISQLPWIFLSVSITVYSPKLTDSKYKEWNESTNKKQTNIFVRVVNINVNISDTIHLL